MSTQHLFVSLTPIRVNKQTALEAICKGLDKTRADHIGFVSGSHQGKTVVQPNVKE